MRVASGFADGAGFIQGDRRECRGRELMRWLFGVFGSGGFAGFGVVTRAADGSAGVLR
jgi:hypothetical protein